MVLSAASETEVFSGSSDVTPSDVAADGVVAAFRPSTPVTVVSSSGTGVDWVVVDGTVVEGTLASSVAAAVVASTDSVVTADG